VAGSLTLRESAPFVFSIRELHDARVWGRNPEALAADWPMTAMNGELLFGWSPVIYVDPPMRRLISESVLRRILILLGETPSARKYALRLAQNAEAELAGLTGSIRAT
jgi:hypothetical protein